MQKNLKIINWAERRIKRRHKAPDLQVKIKAAGIKRWFRPSVEVYCLDINRYGMAINTDKQFKAKDRIIVAFKGKYINQSNVPAVVTQCVEHGKGYRLSIVFSYTLDSKDYCRRIDNALSRIESLYSNHTQESRAS